MGLKRRSKAYLAEFRGPEATSDALYPLDGLHDLCADLPEQQAPALLIWFFSKHAHSKDQGCEALRSVIV